METQEGTVETTLKDGIAVITFFHPRSNSLPGALLNNLAKQITEAGKNPEASAILLCSKGDKAFCAGASFDELVSIADRAQGKEFFSGFARVINAMRKAPKFVLARVHSKAVGGGVGIACAADYTFGTVDSAVKLSELAVGIGPFVVGPAVERKIGTARFQQMAINATAWHSAEWAYHAGLYAEMHADVNKMDEAIEALCKNLRGSNPEAMAHIKAIGWEAFGHWDELLTQRALLSGTLVLSDFTRNAIASFKSGSR
ncbi:MAG: enoyl-CoA hydratase/isomerase family protein [Bacteroidota bacterium]|jgi:methylglutaconyl-CoA hydratase